MSTVSAMKKISAAFLLVMSFYCTYGQEKFTDPRDGSVYRIITFEGMTWMQENLRYRDLPGTILFDNDKNNLAIYGALYDWKAATKACPAGWHLPSGAEFSSLLNHFEQNNRWGKGPSESESFNIQFGGQQDYEGVFSEMDESGYYWTSTEYDESNAEYFSYLLIFDKPVADISRKADIAEIHGTEKINSYSVRCVKD